MKTQMPTELTLQILDDKDQQVASTTVLFVNEPLKPIPMVGDSITLVWDGKELSGLVFSRSFDYSAVDDMEPNAPLRIVVSAKAGAVSVQMESKPRDRMTTREAANFLGYKPGTLDSWRCAGTGPPFTQIRPRSVRYDRAALKKWMSESLVAPAVPRRR